MAQQPFSLPDHYLYGGPNQYTDPTYDSFVQAAGLARDVNRIEIVMLVSPITFRHPAFYAKAAITIDEMSGGRFVLGLGTGWHADEHANFGLPFPELSERFDMLQDALGYLRQFFDDPALGFESDRYRFAPVDSRPKARDGLRILVGGSGAKRTPDLAGAYGGEFSIAGPEPDELVGRIERARASASSHNRDPAALVISASQVMLSGHPSRHNSQPRSPGSTIGSVWRRTPCYLGGARARVSDLGGTPRQARSMC